MTREKALKHLTECVRIAAEHFPAMAEEYWAALREVEKSARDREEIK